MNRRRLTPEEIAEGTKHIQPMTPEEKAKWLADNRKANERLLNHKFHFKDGSEVPRGAEPAAGKFLAHIPAKHAAGSDPEYEALLKATGLNDEDVHKLSELFPPQQGQE